MVAHVRVQLMYTNGESLGLVEPVEPEKKKVDVFFVAYVAYTIEIKIIDT